jgi:hypothetical protein
MLQCLTSESEEEADSEEREESSIEDLKEIITLDFVTENIQKGFQNAQLQCKKKKKRRLGLKDGEWGGSMSVRTRIWRDWGLG